MSIPLETDARPRYTGVGGTAPTLVAHQPPMRRPGGDPNSSAGLKQTPVRRIMDPEVLTPTIAPLPLPPVYRAPTIASLPQHPVYRISTTTPPHYRIPATSPPPPHDTRMEILLLQILENQRMSDLRSDGKFKELNKKIEVLSKKLQKLDFQIAHSTGDAPVGEKGDAHAHIALSIKEAAGSDTHVEKKVTPRVETSKNPCPEPPVLSEKEEEDSDEDIPSVLCKLRETGKISVKNYCRIFADFL